MSVPDDDDLTTQIDAFPSTVFDTQEFFLEALPLANGYDSELAENADFSSPECNQNTFRDNEVSCRENNDSDACDVPKLNNSSVSLDIRVSVPILALNSVQPNESKQIQVNSIFTVVVDEQDAQEQGMLNILKHVQTSDYSDKFLAMVLEDSFPVMYIGSNFTTLASIHEVLRKERDIILTRTSRCYDAPVYLASHAEQKITSYLKLDFAKKQSYSAPMPGSVPLFASDLGLLQPSQIVKGIAVNVPAAFGHSLKANRDKILHEIRHTTHLIEAVTADTSHIDLNLSYFNNGELCVLIR